MLTSLIEEVIFRVSHPHNVRRFAFCFFTVTHRLLRIAPNEKNSMSKIRLFFATLLLSTLPVPALASSTRAIEYLPKATLTTPDLNKDSIKNSNNSSIASEAPTDDLGEDLDLADVDYSELEMTEAETTEAETTEIDPASTTPEALFEYIQQLEARQQNLEEEIEQLRQQLDYQNAQIERNAQEETTAQAEEEASEESASEEVEIAQIEEEDPMGLDIAIGVTTFNPKTSGLLDFATVGFGGANATAIDGDIATVNYEDNEALRYSANIQFADSPIDVGFSTTNVTSQGSATASAPAGGLLFATLANPSQGERATDASADSSLAYSVTDLEVGYSFDLGTSATTRLYGGLRFADISQDTTVRYDGQDFTNAELLFDRNFNGIGVRAGSETKLALGSGFSLFGQAGGALLIGDVSFTQQETNVNGRVPVVAINRVSESQVVPMLELIAGINWLSDIGEDAKLDITFGYAAEQWFNVLNDVRFVDSSGTGSLSQESSDLSSNGLFVELGINFDF